MRTRSLELIATVLSAGLLALAVSATAIAAPPGQGPGGPVLVVTNSADPFSRYLAEILQDEGLNAFDVVDLSGLSQAQLNSHQAVILAQTPVNDAQVAQLTTWVQSGGDLVALRPDPKLGPLLGLGADAGDLAEGYIKVDTGSAPGAGITGATMQFHGTADRHALAAGTRAVAMLYANSTTATADPAVTLRSVGTNGGQAAAFTYDLARSVVWTRQGNPAWAGDKRDGQIDPTRSDDLFFGAKPGAVQPDWVDRQKIAIPQADEQQRLLVNLVTEMSRDRLPLPRFWYLPRGEKAAVVLTGDDHGNGGTRGQFATYRAESPAGCSVAQWECIRSTSYVYPNTPITDAEVVDWQNAGFEVALHLSTGCLNFTRASLRDNWSTQLAAFRASFPSAAAPRTNRTHCITWSDWASEPIVEAENGVRLDANYYYWPGAWVQNQPGLFTGTGFPQRFADTNGSLIDVYQATTQLTDESDIDVGAHIRSLIAGALGANGYYGVFTANMHTDTADNPGADAIIAEATARGVPVVSAAQMLTWLDGRNGSSFGGLAFSGNQLSFSVQRAGGATGLQAMLPLDGPTGRLAGLTRGGAPVATTTQTIKGIAYATFDAQAGGYVATYGAAPPPPPPPPGVPTGPGPSVTPAPGTAGGAAPPAASRTGTGGVTGQGQTSTPGTGTGNDRTAPRIAISPRRLRLTRTGTVRVTVGCPGTERRCRIILLLRSGRRTLAIKSVVVTGGASRTVTLRIGKKTQRTLAAERTLKATISATATDEAGNTRTTRAAIRLLAKKR
jgi:hypothetical protein